MKGLRRVIFWLVVLELIAVFAAATAIRIKLERPTRYIGSALPTGPDLVTEPGAPVLDSGQNEEKIA